MMQAPTRPIIRYHGGKWQQGPKIISYFPPHRIYVEPYCGACSVLLQKPRVYSEIVNDLDGEICNLFRVMRNADQAAELESALRLTPYSREEFGLAYLPSCEEVERARKLMIRAHMGFSSRGGSGQRTGFRANSHRSGSTPSMDWLRLPEQLKSFTARLQGVTIENKSALEIMRQQDRGDVLFYVDPPYVWSTRCKRWPSEKGYRYEMSDDDHREMAEVLLSLTGSVVLSGYASELYEELFGDWCSVEIATFADGARARQELLWFNPKAVRGLQQAKEAARASSAQSILEGLF